jgi:hypothetical protein
MMEMKVCVEKTGGLMVLADSFGQVMEHNHTHINLLLLLPPSD